MERHGDERREREEWGAGREKGMEKGRKERMKNGGREGGTEDHSCTKHFKWRSSGGVYNSWKLETPSFIIAI